MGVTFFTYAPRNLKQELGNNAIFTIFFIIFLFTIFDNAIYNIAKSTSEKFLVKCARLSII